MSNRKKRPPLSQRRFLSFLIQRLHRGEQEHFADAVGTGKQHDATVDAHTHTARGRHAVFQSGEEILIQHLGLVVAALAFHRICGGLLLIYPGLVTDLVGLALIAVVFVIQLATKKKFTALTA